MVSKHLGIIELFKDYLLKRISVSPIIVIHPAISNNNFILLQFITFITFYVIHLFYYLLLFYYILLHFLNLFFFRLYKASSLILSSR